MKRRILALGLALVLACSMSTVALAESKDVTIQVIQKDIQSTNISWDSLEFVFTYTSAEEGTWNKNTANVTVTNNSPNVSINASSSMADKGGIPEVEVGYSGNGSVTTLAANGGSVTYTVTVGGTPANLNVAQTVVGTITVTIS